MRKLVLGMFVSVDGFVSGPNGEVDWIFKSGDDSTDEWIVENLWQAGIIAMGRRSFSEMADYWPNANTPFAPPMNKIPKVVFTKNGIADQQSPHATTMASTETISAKASTYDVTEPIVEGEGTWSNPIVVSGNLSEEVARLKAQRGKDIRVLGGASLAQDLAAHGLIDEYQLLIAPVALGKGAPLFSGLSKPLDLQLVSAKTFSGGAIALVYRST
ncbi:dihydrofolate reductase family protein [Oceaniovalibus sp. ACAM 378]|uniref:dihydrofolate reductase family protein n=1 Tax=Oceaniovalibus sp. ACAM 378 TaxID=2599923 RepID=UPI0011D96F9E|nr:dihydrofolate reductase family protein [Oceaniovalibus sp. ACAM 378]TYB86061.1 dihydrofolate reductase [Oceaniovalibus sp. ACAM 378]